MKSRDYRIFFDFHICLDSVTIPIRIVFQGQVDESLFRKENVNKDQKESMREKVRCFLATHGLNVGLHEYQFYCDRG